MKFKFLIQDIAEGLLCLAAVSAIAATFWVWVPFLAGHVR
jgi:hypothetical protein